MKLYHFCVDKHVKNIIKNGITMGGISVPQVKHTKDGYFDFSSVKIIEGFQWLTVDGDPKRQSWDTSILINYKRTEWRLTVEIPDQYRRNLHDPDQIMRMIKGTNFLFDGWDGSENWRVYQGRIPPEWIVSVDKM